MKFYYLTLKEKTIWNRILFFLQKSKSYVFLILLSFIFCFSTYSQNILWKFHVSGSGDVVPNKSIVDKNNDIYIVGRFSGTLSCGNVSLISQGGYNIFLLKFNNNGNILWGKQIGGTDASYTDIIYGLSLSLDGNSIYLAGIYGGNCKFDENNTLTSTGNYDSFISNYDANGNLIWVKNIGGTGDTYQRVTDLKMDLSENLILCGTFQTNIIFPGSSYIPVVKYPVNGFIAKLDPSGNYISSNVIPIKYAGNSLPSIDLSNSDYYFSGNFKDSTLFDVGATYDKTTSMVLYKCDKNLNGQWLRKATGNNSNFFSSCSLDKDENIYANGYFLSDTLTVDSTAILKANKLGINHSHNKYDIFISKYDSKGNLLWFNTLGGINNDQLYKLYCNDTTTLISGYFGEDMTLSNGKTLKNNGGNDVFGLVMDKNANLIYSITAGGTGNDVGEAAAIDHNGNYILVGDFYSPVLYLSDKDTLHNTTTSTRDMFIVKYDHWSLKLNPKNVTCTGAKNGSVNLVAEGILKTPLTYKWSNGATTKDIAGLAAGKYKVTVTDAAGAVKTDSVTLTEPAVINIVPTVKNADCFRTATGTVSLAVSGGTSPYTFNWSSENGGGVNATSQNQPALTAGTYSVIVTDHNSCKDTLKNIKITQPDSLQVSTVSIPASSSAATDGSVTSTVKGGTAAYSYLWPNSATTPNLANITSGTYSVTVTDSKSCKAYATAYVSVAGSPQIDSVKTTNPSCPGSSDGKVQLWVSGGSGTYTYSWKTGEATKDISGLVAGKYTVTVENSDGSGMVQKASATLNDPSALSTSFTTTPNRCNGDGTGAIDLTVCGGSLPYSYLWSNASTSEDLSGINGGTYSAVVTDAKGCKANTGSINLTQPPALSLTAIVKNISCNSGYRDGSISLTVSGGTGTPSFAWSNGLATSTINLLGPDTYYCTVTDAKGCTFSTAQTVTQPDPIVAAFTTTDVSCSGGSDGSATVSPSGGTAPFNYLWNDHSSQTMATANGLSAGNYLVTLTDANKCQQSDSVAINQPGQLQASLGSKHDINCFGGNDGAIQVAINGGKAPYSYSWSNGATTQNVNGLQAGDYTVTINDVNNCSTTLTVTLTQPATKVNLSLNTFSSVKCNNGNDGVINVSVNGGIAPYTYSWSAITGRGFVQGQAAQTTLTAGTYQVVAADANGCLDTLIQTIDQPVQLGVLVTKNNDVSCHNGADGKITAIADGGTAGYTYSISPGTTTNTDGVFSGLSSNDYTITVTDANNCTAASPAVTIANPDTLVFSSIDSTAVSCHNSSDGSIIAAATGGNSPYTFSLNGGNSNSTGIFNGLTAGLYMVAVVDAKGCQASRPAIHVINPEKVVISLTDSSSVKCFGNSDAKLQATATGGSSPYTFTMKGYTLSNKTGLFSNLSAGSYMINVADANGCRDSISKILRQPAKLGVTLMKDNDITCHNAGDGKITASATGGTIPYSYALAPGSVKNSNGIFSGLKDNYYMVIVTDANNCFAVNDRAIQIVNPDSISVASLDTTAITCHNAADGIIKAAATGGTSPYVYKLNGGQANADGQYTNLPEGKFAVTVTDANNCPGAQTRVVTFANPDSVNIVSVDSTNVTCQNGPGSITVVAKGGTLPLTYSTSGTSNHDGKFTNIAAGTYTITVTDSNNCPQAVSKPVNVVDQTVIQNFNIIEKGVIK